MPPKRHNVAGFAPLQKYELCKLREKYPKIKLEEFALLDGCPKRPDGRPLAKSSFSDHLKRWEEWVKQVSPSIMYSILYYSKKILTEDRYWHRKKSLELLNIHFLSTFCPFGLMLPNLNIFLLPTISYIPKRKLFRNNLHMRELMRATKYLSYQVVGLQTLNRDTTLAVLNIVIRQVFMELSWDEGDRNTAWGIG